MSDLDLIRVAMPGDLARIKVGYITWYRQRYAVHSEKFPAIRDRMSVVLLNFELLNDRDKQPEYWSVVTQTGERFGMIPVRFLEMIEGTGL